MKTYTQILFTALLTISQYAQSATDAKISNKTETFLSCEGIMSSYVGYRFKNRSAYTITKVGKKITKVVHEKGERKDAPTVYTANETRVNFGQNRPADVQLIEEDDKLTLTAKFPEENNAEMETIIFSDGTYKYKNINGSEEGECSVTQKAF